MNLKFGKFILTATLAIFLIVSCSKDDDGGNSQYKEVNNWIYSVLDFAYLWTDQLPDASAVNENLPPLEYFEELRYSGDRFSVLYEDYQELVNSLNGVSTEPGFEYLLARSGDNGVVMMILYTKPESPADDAGLMRGDIITAINDTQMNLDNYQAVISSLGSNHSLSYSRYNSTTDKYKAQAAVEIQPVQYAENPNYLDTVYTINNRKIGYYVYNFFSPGSDSTYDTEMTSIISKFKTENIQDLVLDLRYNSGGSVNSATNLGSLIGTNVSNDKIFYSDRYNNTLQQNFASEYGSNFFDHTFIATNTNIGSQLNSNLYVLVGSRTASASELIINGLDPYMNVTIIGETTVGKNVASSLFEDEESGYGMLPIIAEIRNSKGFSDYANGFTPAGDNFIEEFDDILLPLGDTNEVLLARALDLINGTNTNGRSSSRVSTHQLEPIYSSIDKKARSNRMIITH